MKVCPVCNKTYNDEYLNFCLDDGTTLQEIPSDEPPPTLIMDSARRTNPNYEPQFKDYEKPAFDDYDQQQFSAPNQQIYQQPFGYPQAVSGHTASDRTLPLISLILGGSSLFLMCCYLGIPLGGAALVVGFLGMKKIDSNPQMYDGKGLAIAGMILGGISLLISLGMILLWGIGSIFG